MKKRKYIFFPLLILSLLVHVIFISIHFEKDSQEVTNHKFKIQSIRTVGQKKGHNEKLMFVKTKEIQKKKKTQSQPKLNQLAFKDLPIPEKTSAPSKKKKFKKLQITKNNMRDFLKSAPPGHLSPAQALRAMSDTDIDIKLEVPKGIPEDELNKHELVFYSFQKRTVLAYINSFQKELNSFERKNPHLRFPLTQEKQKLSGRVVYDKNGDILKIETLQWSQIEKLQGFFMKVLNNMSSLPNPPDEVLENEQFAINFVLTLNN